MQKRLLLILLSLAAFIVGVGIFFNTYLVERLYIHQNQKAMEEAYHTLLDSLQTSDQPEYTLIRFSMTEAVDVVVYDQDQNEIYSTRRAPQLRGKIENPLGFSIPFQVEIPDEKEQNAGPLEKDTEKLLEKLNGRTFYTETRYVPELDTYFLTLVGTFETGEYITMFKSMNGIKSSIHFFNGFLLVLLGAFLAAVGLFLLYISQNLIKPVVSVSKIAEKMADLDFSEKYEGSMHDEVGVLGNSINTLSDKLEDTITGLTQANITLSESIAEREQQEKQRLDFVHGLAHELKTPAALIAGYVEGLKENIASDEESRAYYCDIITDEVARMDGIVKNMLSLSEIAYGEQPLTIVRFSITELLQKITERYRLVSQPVDYTFDRDIFVLGDIDRITDVIDNYITNAIHYKAEGSRITVWAEVHAGKVRVAVQNDGQTLSEEESERIWESFYKADKARSRSYGGSGLGLPIVRATIHRHGNECGVYNTDTGVCFWFELTLFAATKTETGE